MVETRPGVNMGTLHYLCNFSLNLKSFQNKTVKKKSNTHSKYINSTIQLHKIPYMKVKVLENQCIYVTRKHCIFPLSYQNAVLNVPKKPLITGNICPRWGRRITWVWEKGTTHDLHGKDTRSRMVNWNERERKQRWQTTRLNWEDKYGSGGQWF